MEWGGEVLKWTDGVESCRAKCRSRVCGCGEVWTRVAQRGSERCSTEQFKTRLVRPVKMWAGRCKEGQLEVNVSVVSTESPNNSSLDK